MNATGELGVLFIICLLLVVHIGYNFLRFKKKYNFVHYLKERMNKRKMEKDGYLKEENLIFHSMPHCVFDKESNSFPDTDIERYGELYELYKHKSYYVLLHFTFEETESVIKENLEVSELKEKEKNRFIADHTFDFKKYLQKERRDIEVSFKNIRDWKFMKKAGKKR